MSNTEEDYSHPQKGTPDQAFPACLVENASSDSEEQSPEPCLPEDNGGPAVRVQEEEFSESSSGNTDSSDGDTDSEEGENEIETEEARKQLKSFEEISQKLLEELSILEAEFQMETMSEEQEEMYPNDTGNESLSWHVSPLLSDVSEEILVSSEDNQEDPEQAASILYVPQDGTQVHIPVLPETPEEVFSTDKGSQECTEQTEEATNHMQQKTPEEILSPLRMVQEITNSISDTSCNCQEQVKVIPVIHELREDTLTPHIKDLDHIQKAADTTREEILVLNKQPEQISSDKRDTDITNKGTDFKNSQQIKVECSKELLAEGKELKESVDPSVNEGDQPPSKEVTMIYLSDEGLKELLTEDKEQKESIDQSLNTEDVDQHPIKDVEAIPEAFTVPVQSIKEDINDQTIDNAPDSLHQLKNVETIPEASAPPVEFSKEDITDQTIDNAQDYQQQLQNGAEISLSDEGSKELLAEGKEVMESIDQSVNAEEGDQHPVKAMPEVPASEEFIKEDNTDQTIDNAQEYQQQLKILQETITRLIEEKRKAFLQIEDLNNEIRKVKAELENERQEGKSLLRTLAKNQRMFQKLNRVSVMVSHEYNDMVQQLELQENLRQEAEHLAHTMLIEKQAANRQSMLLMQNVEPSVMLVHALEEVRRLTCALDETKQELQTKVVSLESQLTERPSEEEFDLIREELKATSKEKRALHDQLKEAKETCSLLEGKIKALEEHKKKEESISSGNDELVTEAPIPPPPPVPPPPPPTLPYNCSENALTLIRHRRGSKEAGLATLKPAKNVDVKAEAMKEMVERIKNGVVLRPARKEGQKHTQAINKRKSVINEFKGIFTDTMRKPNQRKSFRRASKKVAENELDGILRRRRKKVDCAETDGSAETTAKQEKKVEERAPGNMHLSDLKSTLNPGSTQKNPIVVKLRQKSSSLQKSRRTLLDYE